MKYRALLKKLMPLILALGLAGCWVMSASAEAGSTPVNEGQVLKFKRKFSDNVYINFNPRIPLYLTKRASLTKTQARQFILKNDGVHLSLVQKLSLT